MNLSGLSKKSVQSEEKAGAFQDINDLYASLPSAVRLYGVLPYLGPTDPELIYRAYSLLWSTRWFWSRFLGQEVYVEISRALLSAWHAPCPQDAAYQRLRKEYLENRERRTYMQSGRDGPRPGSRRHAREQILDDLFAQQPFVDAGRFQLNPVLAFRALTRALESRGPAGDFLFTNGERRCLEQFLLHCLAETVHFCRDRLVPAVKLALARFEPLRALQHLRLSDPSRSEAFNRRLLRMDAKGMLAQVGAFNQHVGRADNPLTTHSTLLDSLVPEVPLSLLSVEEEAEEEEAEEAEEARRVHEGAG